jgi:hypothetical protein
MGIGWKKRKESAERAMRRERQLSTIMWNVCSEMRERERKERGEIQMKTEEDKMDGRDIEKEGKDRKRKGGGWEKNVNFWNCIFMLISEIQKPGGQIKHCINVSR